MLNFFCYGRFIAAMILITFLSQQHAAGACISIQYKTDTVSPGAIYLHSVKKISVLSMTREPTDKGTASASSTECSNWQLSKDQFSAIIREFKQMSGETQQLVYSYYPCRLMGEIMLDKKKYKYWLNAGATLVLTDAQKNSFYFGCAKEKCKTYFISIQDKAGKP